MLLACTPQDLFIVARVAIATGDHDHARRLRARVAEAPQVMPALVVRELDVMLADVASPRR
jgi:hypothetical protein